MPSASPILAACALAACSAASSATDQSTRCTQGTSAMTSDNKALVRRIYDDFINTGRVEHLDDVVSPDFVGVGGQRGPAAFAAPIIALRAAFPDIQYTTDQIVAEGDRVAVRWTWRGTFTSAFRSYAPNGKQMTNTGMAIFQIAGGKIVHSWLETDRLGFLIGA